MNRTANALRYVANSIIEALPQQGQDWDSDAFECDLTLGAYSDAMADAETTAPGTGDTPTEAELRHAMVILKKIAPRLIESYTEGRREGRAARAREQEACPGCGAMPGDGYTPGCNHEYGCGHGRLLEATPYERTMAGL